MLKIRKDIRTNKFVFLPLSMSTSAMIAIVNPNGIKKQSGVERFYSFHKTPDNAMVSYAESDYVKDKSYDDPSESVSTAEQLVSFFMQQNPQVDISLSWVTEILRRESYFKSGVGSTFDSLLLKLQDK